MPTTTDNYDQDFDNLTPEQRFGVQVRANRTVLGASQEGLAQQLREEGLPLTQAQVSRIEEGKRPVRLDEAAVLCRVLGLDPVDTLSVALAAAGTPDRLAERALFNDLARAIRELEERILQLDRSRREVRLQLEVTTAAHEQWMHTAQAMKTPPHRRDVSGLPGLLDVARRVAGGSDDQ